VELIVEAPPLLLRVVLVEQYIIRAQQVGAHQRQQLRRANLLLLPEHTILDRNRQMGVGEQKEVQLLQLIQFQLL
jgi:hypothetical protein